MDKVIQRSYALLGLISFFTVGEPEVRAWTIKNGTTAVRAAGAVHTDMERGFIRAEVVTYDDFVALGGLSQARTAGKVKVEGKDYVVQDGDVILFRFNV
jgi:ribosome-binding ATPase YchF (GTP1/OBG family)